MNAKDALGTLAGLLIMVAIMALTAAVAGVFILGKGRKRL